MKILTALITIAIIVVFYIVFGPFMILYAIGGKELLNTELI